MVEKTLPSTRNRGSSSSKQSIRITLYLVSLSQTQYFDLKISAFVLSVPESLPNKITRLYLCLFFFLHRYENLLCSKAIPSEEEKRLSTFSALRKLLEVQLFYSRKPAVPIPVHSHNNLMEFFKSFPLKNIVNLPAPNLPGCNPKLVLSTRWRGRWLSLQPHRFSWLLFSKFCPVFHNCHRTLSLPQSLSQENRRFKAQ